MCKTKTLMEEESHLVLIDVNSMIKQEFIPEESYLSDENNIVLKREEFISGEESRLKDEHVSLTENGNINTDIQEESKSVTSGTHVLIKDELLIEDSQCKELSEMDDSSDTTVVNKEAIAQEVYCKTSGSNQLKCQTSDTVPLPQLSRSRFFRKSLKKYSCDVCKKVFRLLSNLSEHKLTHRSMQIYQCDIFNKVYNKPSSFLSHKLIHSGSKKYQCEICELISGKWHNIRDSFIKRLKKRSGQGTVKKYLYHDNLQFLLKVVQKDNTQSSIKTQQLLEPENGEEMTTEVGERDDTYATTNTRTFNPRKKPKSHHDIDREILIALISNKRTPDEDEAFFISVTPSVRSMREEDKLQFRVSVLKLIQDLKSRAKYWSIASCSPASSSNSLTSTPSHLYPTSNNDYRYNYQQPNAFQYGQVQLSSDTLLTNVPNVEVPSTSFAANV